MKSIYELKDLINLESKTEQDRLPLKDQKERIVIGHNVSYDRSRIKEQYFIEGTKVRFFDTMALHIAISGITSFQRNMLHAAKSGTTIDRSLKNPQYWNGKSRKTEEILEWQNVSSFNGLNDVYKLYCGGLGLDKEKRNIFVTGSLTDIKDDFQQLVTYCARDCQATYRILCVLLPEFQKRFPHPVTVSFFFIDYIFGINFFYSDKFSSSSFEFVFIVGWDVGNEYFVSTGKSQLATIFARI